MEQHEQHAHRAAVERARWRGELRREQVGLQEGKETDEEPLERGPSLVAAREQQLGHEHPVREQLEPCEGEAGQPRRLQRLEGGRKGRERLRL